HGKTDDYSYNILEDPVHIRDLNATILNQLGINHEQLTFRYQGLDQRLTGVEEARVIKEILS
ncbi:MAG TPA: sulfatase, partial [Verrucomicrobiales bacterium]|nr:sulfatase [Verrucomicrobiales bacterium]